MIEIKDVTKKFGKFTAVQNVSISVDESSIYGLVGCNGAGKTTLLKTAAGIYKADAGKVLIDGENVFDNETIRRNLFYIPDDLFFLSGSTMETMASFYKGYYPSFSDKVFENVAKLFELDTKKRIHGFSKGMQRQAEITFALACRPKYMLLDECFDGLDPKKRGICRELFLEYMAESGCSMIMSSHNLPELSNLCDHIGLINGKKLVFDKNVDDLSENYIKYRVIFNNDVEENIIRDIDCKDVKIEGKVATFVSNGNVPEIDNYLKNLNPVDIAKSVLTVEEIFMSEMGGEDYDISKIFEV